MDIDRQNGDGISEIGENVIEYRDGGHYEGDILDGKREGYGIYSYQSYSYEGNWTNDTKHGGAKEIKDKQIFEGMFQKGQKKSGNTVYANGYIYNGSYEKNMRNG